MKKYISDVLAGFAAGSITGLFGAGGGMVLVPLLCLLTDIEDESIFPTSICVILPLCLVCLFLRSVGMPIPWKEAFPYLIGSALGGILTGVFGKKIPVKWLHRLLGAMILWGGIRYLC